MLVCVPETLRTSKLPAESTLITSRPTIRVVEGPAGLSVGKRKTTLCPISSSVDAPPARVWVIVTAPFEGKETDFPFPENVKAEPVPPLMTFPPVAWGGVTLLPPVPDTSKANEHACPAAKCTVKSAEAADALNVTPAAARMVATA